MSRASDNEDKLSDLERFVRELLRDVLGMELNDEEQDDRTAVGICLYCGSTEKRPEPQVCPSCQGEFRTVSGLFGINNISQLIAAVEDLRNNDCSLDEFEERFSFFLELWEGFAESWELPGRDLGSVFQLDSALDGVYGKLLTELDEGIAQLGSALEIIETRDEGDTSALEQVEDHVRLFSRRVCSASAGIFTKLESRDGDFSSLLDAFGSF